MKTYRLNTVNLKQKVFVHSLNCNGSIRRRLLDLGICPKTLITPLFKSITGDSTAYFVRGSTIALRNEDANNILVVLDR